MFDRHNALRNALCAGLIASFVFGQMAWSYYQGINIAKQQVGRDVAQNFSLRIVERLYESIGPTYMLASLVRKNNGIILDFDVWAADLIHEFPLLRTLELAPGGVVTHVFPLQGNEIVIGHDLLKDKARNKDAHLAVSKRQMSVSGPVNLMQGGSAAIARYPIFIQHPNGRSYFWGFSIALVNIEDLLAVAGEMELERAGFDYQLCRVTADTDKCEVFAWRGRTVSENHTTVKIGLPNANWLLTLSPTAEVGFITLKIWLFMAVVAASLMVAGGLYLLQLRRPDYAISDESIS
jgi:sensor domain CHASE-containing protein